MGTVNKFGTARLLDPANYELEGQARVNAEIFTAVEIIGRKLERVETERDRLAQRLALIESSAAVDEKTGRLYLPALIDQENLPHKEYATPKWAVAMSLMSSAVALFALGLVLFREPAPALTKEQLAALNSISSTQFTQLTPDSKGWKNLTPDTAENMSVASSEPVTSATTAPPTSNISATPAVTASQTANIPSAAPPDAAELAKVAPPPAETQKPVDTQATTPTIAAAAPPVPPPDLPKIPALEQAAAANKAAANDQNVLIPGEDDAPAKAPEKAAAKEPEPAQNNDNSKTATVVPALESKGGIAPDKTLKDKLAQLQKRAYQGIPEAQHDLATLYAAGTMVPQDYHRAAFWFTKAADGGVANAHYNMGVIYHQGLGVPVDMAKALKWYEQAAELGHPEAMYNLGIAYVEGVGTKVDVDKGVSYFKRAAKAGVSQAAFNLGVLYESNFIGPIDIKKAIEWYKLADKQGHSGAHDALARLQAGDTGTTAGSTTTAAAPDTGDQALTLADKVEPAAGGDEETGEGDSSPASENNPPKTLLADIQRILIKQGLLPGKADGILNQQTEDVIRTYQKKAGLAEDGQPSQELLEKLLQDPPKVDKQFP